MRSRGDIRLQRYHLAEDAVVTEHCLMMLGPDGLVRHAQELSNNKGIVGISLREQKYSSEASLIVLQQGVFLLTGNDLTPDLVGSTVAAADPHTIKKQTNEHEPVIGKVLEVVNKKQAWVSVGNYQ